MNPVGKIDPIVANAAPRMQKAKDAMTMAAEASLRGDPQAPRMAEQALAALEAARRENGQ